MIVEGGGGGGRAVTMPWCRRGGLLRKDIDVNYLISSCMALLASFLYYQCV